MASRHPFHWCRYNHLRPLPSFDFHIDVLSVLYLPYCLPSGTSTSPPSLSRNSRQVQYFAPLHTRNSGVPFEAVRGFEMRRLRQLRRAAKRRPNDFNSHLQLFRALLVRENIGAVADEATREGKLVCRLERERRDPNRRDPLPSLWLGVLLMEGGYVVEAEESFLNSLRILQLQEKSFREEKVGVIAKQGLALLKLRVGELRAGLAQIRDIAGCFKGSSMENPSGVFISVFCNGAAIMGQLGKLHKAQKWAQRAVELAQMERSADDLALAQEHLANVLLMLQKPLEALPLLDLALSSGFRRTDVVISRSRCLVMLGRAPEALSELEKEIRLDPSYPYLHVERGKIFLQMGDFFNATNYFKEALRCFRRLLAGTGTIDELVCRSFLVECVLRAIPSLDDPEGVEIENLFGAVASLWSEWKNYRRQLGVQAGIEELPGYRIVERLALLRALLRDLLPLVDPSHCCASCGTSGASMKCSRCRLARYCGSSCQRRHWRTHKSQCIPE